jgi:sugar/nucleoside kinase (ribokinase family)
MIVPAYTFILDEFPPHNTGARIEQVAEFISDDAAIVATLLRGWRTRSALIGTALGNDARGRAAVRRFKRLGVRGNFRLSRLFPTPHEVNISDRTGHRTYFWQRDPDVLDTLDTANLALLNGAKMLYVDWYDGDHIIRPMQEAARLSIPVFLNLEHAHEFPHALVYVRHASIVQANTDAAQRGGDALAVAHKILDAGAQIVLMTLAGEGCVAVTREQTIRVDAPRVEVIDGCGAGAAFSAGFIYAHLRGWDLNRAVRFAIATGSFKCTRVGLDALPLRAVTRLARSM